MKVDSTESKGLQLLAVTERRYNKKHVGISEKKKDFLLSPRRSRYLAKA